MIGMTDSLYESIAAYSAELMKYGFTPEEFAVLVQENGMCAEEILAVAKTFEYLRAKQNREMYRFPL